MAGGLSQSAVAAKTGSRTPITLVIASATLAFCLLFMTDLVSSLPKAILAVIVLTAVAGLIDVSAMRRLWRVSGPGFAAAATALTGVLLLGMLQGLLLAVLASVLMLLFRASRPHVAILGRVPGTAHHSDIERHPENETIPGVLAFRPEGSLLYVSVDAVIETILARTALEPEDSIRLVICDLSASPHVDLAAAEMLRDLRASLESRAIRLAVTGAHGNARDLLRREGVADLLGGIERAATVDALLLQVEKELAAHLEPGREQSIEPARRPAT